MRTAFIAAPLDQVRQPLQIDDETRIVRRKLLAAQRQSLAVRPLPALGVPLLPVLAGEQIEGPDESRVAAR